MADNPTSDDLSEAQRAATEAMLRRRQQAETATTTNDEQRAATEAMLNRRPESERPVSTEETIWDTLKSTGSGIVRGTVSLADTPDYIGRMLATGANKAYGAITNSELSPETMSMIRSMGIPGQMPNLTYALTGKSVSEQAQDYIPEVVNYEPKTTPGEYGRTIGEFAPSAVLGPGGIGRNLLMQGVVPAVTSETAGQLTEGTWAEPYARFAGALAGGFGGNLLENKARTLISPGGGASSDDLANAARLREANIPVSAGLATKSPRVMEIEANNPTLQAIHNAAETSPQYQAMTTAFLKEAGLTDDMISALASKKAADPSLVGSPQLASKFVMDELYNVNGALFDQALNGVNVIPLRRLTDPLRNAAKIPNAPYEVNEAIKLLSEAARNGTTVPALQLNRIRSELGKNLSSIDGNTQASARMARDAIDELIDNATHVMGDPSRMNLLMEARRRHQALLVLTKALKTNTPTGASGVIRPQDLVNALKSIYGPRRVATGNVGAMGDVAESSLNTLGPLGRPSSSWKNLIPFAETLGGGGFGYGILQLGAALQAPLKYAVVPAALATGVATADATRRLAKTLLERNAHRPLVQKYLENQMVNPTSGVGSYSAAVRGAASGIPSYLYNEYGPQANGGRVERKSGGRVGIDHERLADQLVGAAERAKKGISKGTEQLLDLPDDHIAHALELANRSI